MSAASDAGPRGIALDIYLAACAERFALDGEYRARIQRELFETDAHRSIQASLEAHRFEQSMKTTNRRRTA